eukprot:scaffold322675_cov20-Prasinocladus_malaysianus.AAC.2
MEQARDGGERDTCSFNCGVMCDGTCRHAGTTLHSNKATRPGSRCDCCISPEGAGDCLGSHMPEACYKHGSDSKQHPTTMSTLHKTTSGCAIGMPHIMSRRGFTAPWLDVALALLVLSLCILSVTGAAGEPGSGGASGSAQRHTATAGAVIVGAAAVSAAAFASAGATNPTSTNPDEAGLNHEAPHPVDDPQVLHRLNQTVGNAFHSGAAPSGRPRRKRGRQGDGGGRPLKKPESLAHISDQEWRSKSKAEQKRLKDLNPSRRTRQNAAALPTDRLQQVLPFAVQPQLPAGRTKNEPSSAQDTNSAPPAAGVDVSASTAPSKAHNRVPKTSRGIPEAGAEYSNMRPSQHQIEYVQKLAAKHGGTAPHGQWWHIPWTSRCFLRPGSSVSDLYLKETIMWDPPSIRPHLIGSEVMPCPTCGASDAVEIRQKWYGCGARRLHDLDKTIYLWGRLYCCGTCAARHRAEAARAKQQPGYKPKKVQHFFLSYNRKSMEIMGRKYPFILQACPFILTHRSGKPTLWPSTSRLMVYSVCIAMIRARYIAGITRRLMGVIQHQQGTGMSFSALASLLGEMHRNAYAQMDALYCEYLLANKCNDRQPPHDHPQFSAFDDPEGYNGSSPSARYLQDVAAASHAQRRSSLIRRMMMITGDVLKGDHTFKVVKKIVADKGALR